MKGSRRRIMKIIAGSIAILLIGAILFITNAFVGNPISAALANSAVKQHIEQNYSHLDLIIVQKARYNFKDSTYTSKVQSRTSKDTQFHIYCRGGKVISDEYESLVLSHIQTLTRLSNEYTSRVKNVLDDHIDQKFKTVHVLYDFDSDELKEKENLLKLDMEFDRKLPIQAELSLGIDSADISLESISHLINEIHQLLVRNEYKLAKYTIYAEKEEILVMASGITPKHIESSELLQLLERAEAQEEYDGIIVFIKK